MLLLKEKKPNETQNFLKENMRNIISEIKEKNQKYKNSLKKNYFLIYLLMILIII